MLRGLLATIIGTLCKVQRNISKNEFFFLPSSMNYLKVLVAVCVITNAERSLEFKVLCDLEFLETVLFG